MNNNKYRHPVSGIDEKGHPYSCGCIFRKPEGRDDDLLDSLSTLEQRIVRMWVRERLLPRKTFNDKHTSYGLKHYLHSETGVYMTNNQFKDLMLREGYKPRDPHRLNWEYAISEKSPVFRPKAYLERRCPWLTERAPELVWQLREEYEQQGKEREERRSKDAQT